MSFKYFMGVIVLWGTLSRQGTQHVSAARTPHLGHITGLFVSESYIYFTFIDVIMLYVLIVILNKGTL